MLGQPSQPNLLQTVRNVIAVASGKGGVGKSTVAANLALALADTGAETGLLDLDVYGPSVPIMFGVRSQPDTTDDGILPIVKHGIKIFSIGFLTERGTPIMWRGPMIGKFLGEAMQNVLWGETDYMVVDMPPGTGDAALSLAQAMPVTGTIVVTTPQDVALEDVMRSAHMFKRLRVPLVGVVENMSYYVCPHCGQRDEIFSYGGGRKAADELGVPFLGEVPLNIAIRTGGDEGIPIMRGAPQSPQAKAFAEIAANVMARLKEMEAQESGVIPMTGL
jgi:ATP-binding protein involved in chromosome partitioning